jgi:hypothetical protein
MPYIKKDGRVRIDAALDGLKGLGPGDAAYLLTKASLVFLEGRGDYAGYSQAIGILETVKMELYRRALAPYEDKKIEENGDVF